MKLGKRLAETPSGKLGSRLAIIAALAATPGCASKVSDTKSPESPRSELSSKYHTEREDTRTISEIEASHPGASETVDLALKAKGKMDPKEALLMQKTHEEVYEQYINPSFIQYLKQTGLSDTVFSQLDLLMRYPNDFEYLDKGNFEVEIIKRRPHTKERSHIPDTFRLVMATAEQEITRVGGLKLTKDNGTTPWQSNYDYNRRMTLYRERFKNEQHRNLYGPDFWQKYQALNQLPEIERIRAWKNMLDDSYVSVSGPIKALYELDNVDFPKRYVDLVQARHFDFEVNHPSFLNVKNHQRVQGKNYKEITSQRDKLQIVVIADPKHPGVYQIITRAAKDNPVRIDKRGYLLLPQEDGSYAPDPRYPSH